MPGNAEESLLVEKVDGRRDAPEEPLAPARGRGRPGLDRGRGALRREPVTPPRAGPDWWSLRPIRRPAVPALTRSSRGRAPHPDRRLHPGQAQEKGLAPGPEADRADADPPPDLRPDRPAADARGGRRVRRRRPTRRLREAGRPAARLARTTASAGAGTGSTWSGSPRATATRPTCRGPTPGPIATTSSGPSTATCRSPGSSSSSSPATRWPDGRLADRRPPPASSSAARTTSSATRPSRGCASSGPTTSTT